MITIEMNNHDRLIWFSQPMKRKISLNFLFSVQLLASIFFIIIYFLFYFFILFSLVFFDTADPKIEDDMLHSSNFLTG